MTPTTKGSFRLFSLAGIGVYIHWSWFFVAIYSIQFRTREYPSMVWNALEYLALFTLVLLHEFGHQLACRQVGGKTHDIVLWPLGGVAYVSPPQRPGAQLWSIAAGPLVNVVLLPLLFLPVLANVQFGWAELHPNASELLKNILFINIGLLIFNLLPFYPLDGGQILRSLLWFVMGPAQSLLVASIVGCAGVVGLVGLAIWGQSIWIGIMAVFLLMSCWRGVMQARVLLRLEKAPRRTGYACPACQAVPLVGEFWQCGRCGKGFDTFLTNATCPHCGVQYGVTQCFNCGATRSISEWLLGWSANR